MVREHERYHFYPKISLTDVPGVYPASLLEFFLLALIILDILSGFWVLILVAFLGLLSVYYPYTIATRIIFSEYTFTIEKILYPAKTYLYTDVVDVGKTVIMARKGNFPLTIMGIHGELYGIFISLIKKGKINQEQLENKIRINESAKAFSMLPAMIISFILWWITANYVPFENTLLSKLRFLILYPNIPIGLLLQ